MQFVCSIAQISAIFKGVGLLFCPILLMQESSIKGKVFLLHLMVAEGIFLFALSSSDENKDHHGRGQLSTWPSEFTKIPASLHVCKQGCSVAYPCDPEFPCSPLLLSQSTSSY